MYYDDHTRAYEAGYDKDYPIWANTAEDAWDPIENRQFVAGCFVWTGFDYKGEPTPYVWPNINSHFGVLDITGAPKDNFYWYKFAWNRTEKGVYVYPHWNWNVDPKY